MTNNPDKNQLEAGHDKERIVKMVNQAIWFVIFFGLPAYSIYLSMFTYTRLKAAIMGPLVKVMFSTGVSLGIIGMSHGLGGFIKNWLEWKYYIILGNISFSVYLVNYAIVLATSGNKSALATFSVSYMLTKIFISIIYTLTAGFFLAMFIELPALSLQKMFLPQLKASSKNDNNPEFKDK